MRAPILRCLEPSQAPQGPQKQRAARGDTLRDWLRRPPIRVDHPILRGESNMTHATDFGNLQPCTASASCHDTRHHTMGVAFRSRLSMRSIFDHWTKRSHLRVHISDFGLRRHSVSLLMKRKTDQSTAGRVPTSLLFKSACWCLRSRRSLIDWFWVGSNVFPCLHFMSITIARRLPNPTYTIVY